LGMVIGEKGVKMDMTKVEAIMSWLMPKCVKNIQAFLGHAPVRTRPCSMIKYSTISVT